MPHTHKWKFHKKDHEWRCAVKSCDIVITPVEYLSRFGVLYHYDPPPVTGLNRMADEREKEGSNETQ